MMVGKKFLVSFNECKSVNFSYIMFSEEGMDLGFVFKKGLCFKNICSCMLKNL